MKKHIFLIPLMAFSCASAAMAQSGTASLQGYDLFGKPMYFDAEQKVNVGEPSSLEKAITDAKSDYEKTESEASAVWYGRLLGFRGDMKASIDVFTKGLSKYPNSVALLRHRAHRYFSIRQFGKSIADGLQAAKLSIGKPLERDIVRPGVPAATPDVLQFYIYYHLGQAYFASHQFEQAAHWFHESRQIALGTAGAPDVTACVYWEYLSLAHATKYIEAKALLDSYSYTMHDMKDNIEDNIYFNGVELFKGHQDVDDFLSDRDTGKSFSSSDGNRASTAFTISEYYILHADYDKARPFLEKSLNVKTWSYFARIQAEAEWTYIFGKTGPQQN
ncbi:tetratricopeptide repeat protein [Acetobacter fallax]|uniref:Tetratricopeptide repeat protein n=1 Tax=Acetobacter fallax TaxID=1737473 RepID=A0ABX0KAA3_9PROT|nr:hypothetical protein [Acetobacter fallax]NHO33352.1 hypothetical protein [Acetobacter fallax]NHO36972.1 hypothetical protein [Acetobacter fallax]